MKNSILLISFCCLSFSSIGQEAEDSLLHQNTRLVWESSFEKVEGYYSEGAFKEGLEAAEEIFPLLLGRIHFDSVK